MQSPMNHCKYIGIEVLAEVAIVFWVAMQFSSGFFRHTRRFIPGDRTLHYNISLHLQLTRHLLNIHEMMVRII
jgi:hypothetical protein